MFSGDLNVDSYASGKNVVNVRLPSVSALTFSEADDDVDMETQVPEGEKAISFSISPKQIPELVTLSLLPKSQWQSLINLDIIKVLHILSLLTRLIDVILLRVFLPINHNNICFMLCHRLAINQ